MKKIISVVIASLFLCSQVFAAGYKTTFNNETGMQDYVGIAKSADVSVVCPSGQALVSTGTGVWACSATIGGSGDVFGPGSSVANNFASFTDVTGKAIKDSGYNASSFLTPSTLSIVSDTPLSGAGTSGSHLVVADNSSASKGVVAASGTPATPVYWKAAQTTGAVGWTQIPYADIDGVPNLGNYLAAAGGTVGAGTQAQPFTLGIKLAQIGGSPGKYTTIQGGAQTADITYTLPTSSTNGLLKNTAGALSWDTSSYISTTSADATYVPYAGATGDVNLGAKNLTTTGKVTVTTADTSIVQFNNSPTVGAVSPGKLYWDTTYKTLDLNVDANANLQIGQEMYIRAVAGENIANGDAVYISGSTGVFPTIKKAIADGSSRAAARVRGIATEDITSGDEGFITNFGNVNGLNTSGMASGDIVYLSATTPGALTTTRPAPPYLQTAVGRVIVSNASTGSIFRSNVNYPLDGSQMDLQRSGNSTYHSVQDWLNTYSAGMVRGGVIASADASKITVTAGNGLFAIGTLDTDPIAFADWASLDATAVTDQRVTWVAANYNSGTPTITLYTGATSLDSTVPTAINYQDVFPLGYVTRNGTELYVTNNPRRMQDVVGGLNARFYQTLPLARDEKLGGLILGETGTRNITLSGGALWDRSNKFTINSIDTSGAGVFSTWYRNSGNGFIETENVKAWPNTQYDNGSGTLQTVAANRFANQWWYLSTEGRLAMLYGRAIYTTATLAAAGQAPATLPLPIATHYRLIARVTFQGSAATYTAIDSAFSNTFATSAASTHNNLTGLQGGTAGEYYHLNSNQYSTVDTHLVFSSADATYVHKNQTVQDTLVGTFNFPKVGIGVAAPSTNLEILDGTGNAQLKLDYSATKFATVSADSIGNVNICPISGNTQVSGDVTLIGSGAKVYASYAGSHNLMVTNSAGNTYMGITGTNTGTTSKLNFGHSTAPGTLMSPVMTITDNTAGAGKVGIGTTAPTVSLDVAGVVAARDGLIAAKHYPSSDSVGIGIFKADGVTSVVSFDTTNVRVGIGTVAPATALDVNGVITATGGTSTTWNAKLSTASADATYVHKNQTIVDTLTASPIIDNLTSGRVTFASGTKTLTDDADMSFSGSRLTVTDLTSTNTIVGSVNGNAATVTTNANLTGPVTSVGNATAIASNGIQSAGINWSNINALAPITAGGIDWSTLSNSIQTAGINWSSIKNAELQKSGINWTDITTATITGVNWSNLATLNTSSKFTAAQSVDINGTIGAINPSTGLFTTIGVNNTSINTISNLTVRGTGNSGSGGLNDNAIAIEQRNAANYFLLGVDLADASFKIRQQFSGLDSGNVHTYLEMAYDTGYVRLNSYGAGTATFDGSGNLTSVSDERLKDIVSPYSSGLSAIMKIDPILYKYNQLSGLDTENTYAGFSAQNVIKFIPEAVGKSQNGYYSLNDRPIIAALVNSIKELQEEIDEIRIKLNMNKKNLTISENNNENKIISYKLPISKPFKKDI